MFKCRWLMSLAGKAGCAPHGFRVEVSICLIVGICWLVMVAEARAGTPAAAVAEIALGPADVTLAACQSLRVERGEVEIAKNAADQLKKRNGVIEHWHAAQGLRRLEEARLILLLRTPKRCEVLISGAKHGVIPDGWRYRYGMPFRAWHIRDEELLFEGRVSIDLTTRAYKVVSVPGSYSPPLRMYHHGRLEICTGCGMPKAEEVGPGDSVSFHLEGSGDARRFLFRAPVAGDLIVERTYGNMPNVDMLMGADEGHLRSRGIQHLKANESIMVAFRYHGISPRELDVGFLFTPESPLTCLLEVTQTDTHAWHVRLELHNRGREPVLVFRPSASTVQWLAKGKLIAAAYPKRMPETQFIPPEAYVRYEAVLTGDVEDRPDEARVRISVTAGGVLQCIPEHGATAGGVRKRGAEGVISPMQVQ